MTLEEIDKKARLRDFKEAAAEIVKIASGEWRKDNRKVDRITVAWLELERALDGLL